MGLSQNLVLGEYQWILVRKRSPRPAAVSRAWLFWRKGRARKAIKGCNRPLPASSRPVRAGAAQSAHEHGLRPRRRPSAAGSGYVRGGGGAPAPRASAAAARTRLFSPAQQGSPPGFGTFGAWRLRGPVFAGRCFGGNGSVAPCAAADAPFFAAGDRLLRCLPFRLRCAPAAPQSGRCAVADAAPVLRAGTGSNDVANALCAPRLLPCCAAWN